MASPADELKRVPLFSGLSQRQLKRLARGFREREVKSGTSLMREGEKSGTSFFVIVDGTATVSVDGNQVAQLGPGDHFGELALISERVRSATVTADEPMRCLVMGFWDFRRFAKENPDVTWKLLQHVVELLAEQRSQPSSGPSRSGSSSGGPYATSMRSPSGSKTNIS
jgi:CRP/FNR family cyclic AMP-dependent transcriptional regulator